MKVIDTDRAALSLPAAASAFNLSTCIKNVSFMQGWIVMICYSASLQYSGRLYTYPSFHLVQEQFLQEEMSCAKVSTSQHAHYHVDSVNLLESVLELLAQNNFKTF